MITEYVVVLRKVSRLLFSANSKEKDMLLLHSATAAPPSTHEAEPQSVSIEYSDSALLSRTLALTVLPLY